MAAKQIKCFFLALLGVALGHRYGVSLLFKSNHLLSAFIKILVEEDHLLIIIFYTYLIAWHIKHLLEIEVNFHSSAVMKRSTHS